MTTSTEVVLALHAVRTACTGAPAVTAIAADRFYFDLAPADAPYPFIVANLSSSTDVYGVGSTRIYADTEVLVRGYAEADSFDPLGPLSRAIDDALTTTTVVTTGGVVLSARRIRSYAQTEQYEDAQLRALGGYYRIFAQTS